MRRWHESPVPCIAATHDRRSDATTLEVVEDSSTKCCCASEHDDEHAPSDHDLQKCPQILRELFGKARESPKKQGHSPGQSIMQSYKQVDKRSTPIDPE